MQLSLFSIILAEHLPISSGAVHPAGIPNRLLTLMTRLRTLSSKIKPNFACSLELEEKRLSPEETSH